MPEEAESEALKELRRYERMSEGAAEAGMARSYLNWMVEMPWRLPPEIEIDIVEARRTLHEDHYGLEKIKGRIVEYLAVRKLAPEGKAPSSALRGRRASARPHSASRSRVRWGAPSCVSASGVSTTR